MHFQIIKDDYFSKITSELEAIVPEFKTIFDSEDGIYPILGDFGRFLCENVNNINILEKCFDFINYSLLHGGTDTENVIVVQIFEKLYERKELIQIAKHYLSEEGLHTFNKFNISTTH